MMSGNVFFWWLFLCVASGLNVFVWTYSAVALKRRRAFLSTEDYTARRLQLVLSAGYVLGCAFRSVLPVYDVQRLCLFDTWLSSVIVGRSVATFAELCFAAQWALLLSEIARVTVSNGCRRVALAVFPMIAVAEIFSWYSVLTTSNIGHVFEESIWGVVACLLLVSLISIWPRLDSRLRPLLALWCAAGIAYVSFMFLVDVPMYWARWASDEASGRAYLGVAQGIIDVAQRRVVSHRWEDWSNEIAWMSLYFSIAVWLSIALVHVPTLRRNTIPLMRIPAKVIT